MTIHFDIQKDNVSVAINYLNKSNNYTIKHQHLSKELVEILQKEKIDLSDIKKVTIHKSKGASFLNERIANLFKNLVILFR